MKIKHAYEIQEALETADASNNADLYDKMLQVEWVKYAEVKTETVPLKDAIAALEAILPNHLVQRSWSLGSQRMCQELQRYVIKLKAMQTKEAQP